MAGYSGTPLPKKLGNRTGHVVALLEPPKRLRDDTGRASRGRDAAFEVLVSTGPDVIVWFLTRRTQFVNRLGGIGRQMAPTTALWVAWPKQSSGVATDMTENEFARPC